MFVRRVSKHVQFVLCNILPAFMSVTKSRASSTIAVAAEAKAGYDLSAYQTSWSSLHAHKLYGFRA